MENIDDEIVITADEWEALRQEVRHVLQEGRHFPIFYEGPNHYIPEFNENEEIVDDGPPPLIRMDNANAVTQEYEPIGPPLEPIGIVIKRLLNDFVDEPMSPDEKLMDSLTERFDSKYIPSETCINCSPLEQDNCHYARKMLVDENHYSYPLCSICSIFHSTGLVKPCSCFHKTEHEYVVKNGKYPLWMQLQYSSFGSFYNGFHGVDHPAYETICTDRCIVCADNNTKNIGYCFFPRVITEDFNGPYFGRDDGPTIIYSPLKVIMCGRCYINYNTSKIGREITVARCDESSGWQIAAIQFFRQYVYDLHYKCEGVMLCINYRNGFDGEGRKIFLPNEILLMIFNYTWKDCYFEFRRDTEFDRNRDEEMEKWAEIIAKRKLVLEN